MKPAGVVVIAVLYWVSACFLGLVGIGLLVGVGLIGTLSPDPRIAAILAGVGGVGAVFALIFAAVVAFIGWGLFSLREWARIVTIVFAVLGIVSSVGALFFLHFVVVTGAIGFVRLAVNAVIIWYLLQPQVKAVFR